MVPRRARADERYVEEVFTSEARGHGAWALKLTCPGTAGVPDRMVLLPGGGVRFVEVKRPGGRVSAVQARVFARMAELGHPVDVVDSPQAARDWWGSL